MTDMQLARALQSLLKEASIEVGEMIGACLGHMKQNALSTDAKCREFARRIEGHRDIARSERRPFAVAAAEGLLESIRPVERALHKNGAKPRKR